jgi:predicted phage tail component-like protein
MDVLFNSISLSGYAKVLDVRRDILPPRTLTSVKIPARDGEYYVRKTDDSRLWEIEIMLIGTDALDLIVKKRALAGVLDTDKLVPIEISDEPGILYDGIVVGDTDFTQIRHTAKAKISIFLPKGTGYSATPTTVPVLSDTVNVTVDGDRKTYPVIKATFTEDSTFFAVAASDQATNAGDVPYLMVGRPASVEEAPVESEVLVMYDEMETTTGWTTAATTDVDYPIAGTMISQGSAFEASDYGTGSGYHGPALKKSLTSPLTDFTMIAHVRNQATSPQQIGRAEVYLLDVNGNTLAKASMKDVHSAYERNYGEMRLGELTDYELLVNYSPGKYGLWNDFYGQLTVSRIGQRWLVRIGQYDLETSTAYAQHTRSYFDVNNRFSGQLGSVVVALFAHGSYTPTVQQIGSVRVWDMQTVTPEQTPIIFKTDDVLEIDTAKALVTKNGVPFMQYLDPNSTFFGLNPGSNTLGITPVGSANVDITYKERWL